MELVNVHPGEALNTKFVIVYPLSVTSFARGTMRTVLVEGSEEVSGRALIVC